MSASRYQGSVETAVTHKVGGVRDIAAPIKTLEARVAMRQALQVADTGPNRSL